tara:strand:- start:56 stop:598 length:543 start_codon:yes stop_codon:yes gene_type:complete
MDEPTNHLDIVSKDILKKSLIEFDGTLVVISHDRDFLQGLTNKVYEFKQRNIKEHLGDLNGYLQQNHLESLDQLNVIQSDDKIKNEKYDSQQKISYNKKREYDKKVRKIENKISKLEEEISLLELKKKELDRKLSDPIIFKEMQQDKDFFIKYELEKNKIQEKENDWALLVARLEELKKY